MSLWEDQWLNGRSLSSFMSIPQELLFMENFEVSEIMVNGSWSIPQIWRDRFPVVTREIEEFQIAKTDDDELFWDGTAEGVITVKEAYNLSRERSCGEMEKKIGQRFIPPKISIFVWKIISKKLLTATTLHKWGSLPSPVCIGCIIGSDEMINHLLLNCDVARNIWVWLSDTLCTDLLRFNNAVDLIKWSVKQNLKTTMGQLTVSCIFHAVWTI